MRLFLILTIYSINCFSQVNDSLLYQLQQIPNDTERVNQIYKEGFALRSNNPDLSYQYALLCKTEAEKTGSPVHIAKSYNLLGVLAYKKGDYKNALRMQKQALSLNGSVNYDYGIAINQTNLGNIYSDLNQYALAESCYLSAMHAYNNLNNTLHITKTLINIGVLKYEQKQFDAAISQFREALVYVEQLEDHDLKAFCKNNIGTIYREKGLLDSAEIYINEAVMLYELTHAKMELADAYNNMAIVYIKTQSYEGAMDYIQSAELICKEYDYTETLIELYDTRALLFEAQKKYEQALYWTKKHDTLKDSLKKIEDDAILSSFETEEPVSDIKEVSTNTFHNLPLLIMIIVFMISIPLFLIRQTR